MMGEHLFNWASADLLEPRLDAPFYSRQNVENNRWMSSWPKELKSIQDVSSLVTDGTHVTPDYTSSGVPFISARNIDECHVNLHKDFRYISQQSHTQLDRQNCSPSVDDVLVAKSGKIGTAAVNCLPWPFTVFESVAIVRFSRSVDPYYAAAYLNSRFAQNQIRRMQKGAVQKHLHLEDLRELRMAIVPLDVQLAIGNKVRKVERLRELAAQRNSDIRSTVTAYTGVPPAAIDSHSSWVSARDITSRLDSPYFAATVVKTVSDLRSRCDAIPLSSLISEICTGSTPDDITDSDGIAFFPSGSVATDVLSNDAGLFISTRDHAERLTSRVAPKDILCAKDGNTIGHMAVVPSWVSDGNINEHTYRLRLTNPEMSVWLHAFLVSDWGRRQILRESVGSAQAGLGRSFIDNVFVVLHPESSVLEHVQREGMRALDEMQEAKDLMCSIHQDISDLIDGKDYTELLEAASEVGTWLFQNPTPRNRTPNAKHT